MSNERIKRGAGLFVAGWLSASGFALAGGCSGKAKVEGKGVGESGASGSSGASGGSAAGGNGGSVPLGGTAGAGNRAGSDGMAGEGGGCGKTDLAAEPAAVSILLVVDKSSSMTATPSGFTEDKWTALGAALGRAVDDTRDQIAYGLDFYPFGDDRDPMASIDYCEMPTTSDVLVPIESGRRTAPVIADALSDYQPAGGTPTAFALERALDYFTDGDGASLKGDRYVLLATDGGPNCNRDLRCDTDACTSNLDGRNCGGQNCCEPALDPDGPLSCLDEDAAVAAVEALADAGVKTFVVGIPGTQAYGPTLDAMAVAGLVPNPDAPPSYYRVDATGGTAGLAEVLGRITRGVIRSCRLQLGSTPSDPDYEGLLNVEIDGMEVPQMGDDGWDVDRSTDPPTIVLKGATCEAIRTQGAERVSITYGCPTVTDPH